MTHVRKQIRDYVAVTALGGLAAQTAANQIYKTRQFPKGSWPYIAVFALRERVETQNPGHINTEKRYRRTQQVAVEIGVDDGDDSLDALVLQVEQQMAAADTMGGGVQFTDLRSTDIQLVAQGEREYQVARLIYDVQFYVTAADPETFIG